jgi:thiosulfate dehydrogenase [quinone] large subunit
VPAHDVLVRALLPLRAFLGFTFCYAGLSKLANPGFFDATNPVSIQAQLAGAARRSPVHALVSPLGHAAVAIGVLIALGELAVGVGTLLGLWARIAAAGGLVLSFLLFLTVSFHSAPYYTGADIVFVFAWTPLLLAGAGSVSLDAVIAAKAKAQPSAAVRRQWAGRTITVARPGRREIVLKGAVTGVAAVAGMAAAGLAAGLGRLAHNGAPKQASAAFPSLAGTSPSPAAPAAPAAAASAAGASPSSAATAGSGRQAVTGTAIGPAKDVPVGQAAAFTDPRTGDPSLVIHPGDGVFVAFDAVCPHAGCTVQYDPSARVIMCPCHGSQFNAATGAVEVGPAPTGLTRIPVTDGQNGQLYVN